MRQPLGCWIVCLALVGSLRVCAYGQESVIAPDATAWGRFQPGATSRVRIVIESPSAEGSAANTSTTVQTTTLSSVGAGDVELQVDATVEVGGKTFDAPSQTVRQLFCGQAITAMAEVKTQSAGEGNATVEGKTVACQIQQTEIAEQAGKTVVKTYYAAGTPPYVLRIESTTTGGDGETKSQTAGEVIAVDLPYHTSEGAQYSVSVWQETTRKAKGAVERSLTFRSDEVPGGTVARWSKELDAEGHLVRRSTLELIEHSGELATRN